MGSQRSANLEAYLLTDVGRTRLLNEDYVGYFVPDDAQSLAADGRVFVLADGAGGEGAGDVASEYAARKLLHNFFESNEPDLERRLVGAVRAANTDLYEYAISSKKPRMATTVVALHMRGSQMLVVNVGDSRAYLVRGGTIRQITRDHSLLEQLIGEGSITPEEARENPPRNALLRSLGGESSVAVDVFSGGLHAGDILLLCSDGLTRYVDDAEILEAVTGSDGEDACRSLVDLANQRGGDDNVSVVVLRYDPLSSPSLEEIAGGATAEPVTLRAAAGGPSLAQVERGAGGGTRGVVGRDLTGKPRTLTALPEPVSVRERVLGWPWRNIGFGVGVVALGALIVLAVGFWLPGIDIEIGAPSQGSAATVAAQLPVTTVAMTAVPDTEGLAVEETALPTDDGVGIGQATALPAELVTPVLAATADAELSGPLEVFEGEFLYGATANQSDDAVELCGSLGGTVCLAEFFEDAEPTRTIFITRFFIDRSEVTNVSYLACVEEGRCSQPEGVDEEGLGIADYYREAANSNYPVVGVTWEQAGEYCGWAGGRLPTEAEWEKAAGWDFISGQKLVWPWGTQWDPERVNYRDPDAISSEPEAVGSRPDNVSPFGVLDMAGNVSEWVADWYAPDYYEGLTDSQRDPQGPDRPSVERLRVIRGGSWEDNGVWARTVHRGVVPDGHFNKSIGMRCVYDVHPDAANAGAGAGASDAPPLVPGDDGNATQLP